MRKSKVVNKKSVFPASKEKVYNMLSEFEMLSKIAYPYITFKPVDGNKNLIWKAGKEFEFKAKLLGFIPFGTHRIKVIDFDMDKVYTNEVNTYVETWNHEIILKELSDGTTQYSDIVEIYAGWRTPFVYLWATLFYRHRQKKWIKILKSL